MKKKRIIPILLLKEGWLVQSKQFRRYQNLGNPVAAVKRLSEWGADELIYLDISTEESYDLRRDDLNCMNLHSIEEIIAYVSEYSFMPLTVGGKIRTLHDIEKRLALGADKVSINSQAIINPRFIAEAAVEFGSQCIVVSIDVKTVADNYLVASHGGKNISDLDPSQWARIVQNQGAGEILLNSIDRDGMKTGFDLRLLNSVSNVVNIPVIACGGAGEWEHFAEALDGSGVDAVAAANIFQHVDQSVYLAKKYLYDKKFNVRKPSILKVGAHL
jgi:imidazole glycerol-phosphate synthase subunit HisF